MLTSADMTVANVYNLFPFLLLLLQLAHHPTKENGGVSACYGLPVSHQVRLEQTLDNSENFWGKEIIPLKWILRNTYRANPYSLNLSGQEGVRDV